MKCIHCGNDAKLKERSDGCCPGCRRRFAFEPQQGDPITDLFMERALEYVSSASGVRFGAGHAYYELRRRLRKRWRRRVMTSAAATGLFVPLLLLALWQRWGTSILFGILAVIATFSLGRYLTSSERALSRSDFDGLFRRYLRTHGPHAALIEARSEPAQAAPVPDELLDYSFDRAVICDRRELVDLLIANQFHFENNCAVLGIDGYPRAAFEPIRRMLRNNPRLLVLALHDATPAGCRIAYRLRNDAAWFKEQGKVVDLGLRPSHARSFRGMSDPIWPGLQLEATPAFSAKEADWLAHNSLALEVVRPEQLIKRLFRAITEAESKPDTEPAGEGGCGSGSCGSSHTEVESSIGDDADASDGGGDSFG